MSENAEKDSIFQFWRKIKFLGEVLRPQKKKAAVVCVVILLAAIAESFGLSMILPILQVIVDGGLKGTLSILLDPILNLFPENLLLPVLCLFFLSLIMLKSACILIRIVLSKKFIWQIRFDWLNQIYNKYLGSEYAFIISNKHGNLLNNLVNETQRGAVGLSWLTEYLAKIILVIMLYTTLMFVNWQATLILSGAMGAMLLLTNQISKNFASKIGRKKLKLNQQLTSDVAESISGIRQIKVFDLGTWFSEKISRVSSKLSSIEVRLAAATAAPAPLGEIMLSLILVSGICYLFFYTDIPLKSALPLIGVFVVIGQRLVSNVSALAGMRIQILSLLPSVSLAYNLAEKSIAQENISFGIKFQGLAEDIVIKNVTFSHKNGHPVFSRLNITIPRNKTTALIGPSGSGKSTVTDLLLGFYKPQSGQILINGKDMQEWNLASLRSKIGYVSQDTFLFNISIRDNIAFGKKDANEKAIIDAAQAAHAHDFIISLPDGYDTVVAERGMKLSGGQRQRIAIARAIIRNPDIFIFDEATSSLDNESEKLIQKSIELLSKDKTILIIAHRLSTIENADVIYDLGKITLSSANNKIGCSNEH